MEYGGNVHGEHSVQNFFYAVALIIKLYIDKSAILQVLMTSFCDGGGVLRTTVIQHTN